MAENTILDLDTMLDTEMDSIETIADYVTPPPGLYSLMVENCEAEKYKQKAKDGKPEVEALRIKITYKVVATKETDGMPVADGSLFSENFSVTEEGKKFFKRKAMNILNVKEFGDAKMRDIIEGLKGIPFDAAITVEKTDKPGGGFYENARIRPVHAAAA